MHSINVSLKGDKAALVGEGHTLIQLFPLKKMIDAFILLADSSPSQLLESAYERPVFQEKTEIWRQEELDLTHEFSVVNVLASYFHTPFPDPLIQSQSSWPCSSSVKMYLLF